MMPTAFVMSRMLLFPTLILVLISNQSSCVQSQLTFDRFAKDHFPRMARGGKLILTISNDGQDREENEDLNPLLQKAQRTAVKLLSNLGISDDVQEFMIQETLYSCYISEVKTGHQHYGHSQVRFWNYCATF